MKRLIVACTVALFFSSAFAGSFGVWQVKTSKDAMTDVVTADAHYLTHDYGVGFSVRSKDVVIYFIVLNPGKIGLLSADEPIEYRVDQFPSHQFVDANYIWKPTMALGVIGPSDTPETMASIQELLHGKLLRIRIYTPDGASDLTVPLSGACVPIARALGVNSEQCKKP